jgi:hypothetical protein
VRAQHARGHQCEQQHAEHHAVDDERHEALGRDEVHEPLGELGACAVLTCSFIQVRRSTGRGLGELGNQSAPNVTTKPCHRACNESMMARSIVGVTLLYVPSTPAISCLNLPLDRGHLETGT